MNCLKCLLVGILSGALGSLAFGQAESSAKSKPPSNPVIISALGATYDHAPGTLPAGILRDIKDKGFTGIWDAYSPGGFGKGFLEDTRRIEMTQRIIKLLHENNLEVHLSVPLGDVFPVNPDANNPGYFYQGLNEKTGQFETRPGWDLGNEKSLALFLDRSRELFKKFGPVELYIVDEVILADTGDAPHCKTISTYWTGGTYSPACLASFRNYLANKGFPGARTAKFPVTTVEVKPSDQCNMGLPAIKITPANQDRLIADNDWPNSPRWKYWYDWKTELLAHLVDGITTAAWEVWGKDPKWHGCGFNAPPFWYVKELGLDLDKLAAVKHLDYIDCGYMGGTNYEKIRAAAERHGKKWGSTVTIWLWGEPSNEMSPTETFKKSVMDGASILFVYPIASFQTDRKNLPEGDRKGGGFYMPQQVKAWDECIKWLAEYQKNRPIVSSTPPSKK